MVALNKCLSCQDVLLPRFVWGWRGCRKVGLDGGEGGAEVRGDGE